MLEILPLGEGDEEILSSAFAEIGWNKPASQYLRYLEEQDRGERSVFVAFAETVFAGYVTVVWQPEYEPFRLNNVPEVQDLNVLPKFRRQGIATRLMNGAEAVISGRSRIVGVGVGMTQDYGAAQRMYVKRGYVPDGNGLMSSGEPVRYGDRVTADDDLVLYLKKNLRQSPAPALVR